jgi:hypothetical protein
LQKFELIEHFASGATTISWLGECFVFLSIPVFFFVFLSQKNKNTRAIASEKCEQFFLKILFVLLFVFLIFDKLIIFNNGCVETD